MKNHYIDIKTAAYEYKTVGHHFIIIIIMTFASQITKSNQNQLK